MRSRLAAITDPGEFEVLATAVLRSCSSNYNQLIHTGINAAGKPINEPLDGIHIGNDLIVAVEHTTTQRSKLRDKWLASPDGDIEKCITAIAKTREEHWDAIVVLTCTEVPSVELIEEVKARCRHAGVELDLWTGDRIASYLTDNPEGQWIRKCFFGELPERVSRSLLENVSETTLAQQEECRFFPLQASVARQCEDSVYHESKPIHVLLGDSGMGKTVILHRILHRSALESLIVVGTEDEVLDSPTLEAFLGCVVQRTAGLPSLEGSILDFVQRSNRRLTIGIDNVQDERALTKLFMWSRVSERNGSSFVRFLLTAQPKILTQLKIQLAKDVRKASTAIGTFSRDEGRMAVQRLWRSDLSEIEAEDVAEQYGFDPLA